MGVNHPLYTLHSVSTMPLHRHIVLFNATQLNYTYLWFVLMPFHVHLEPFDTRWVLTTSTVEVMLSFLMQDDDDTYMYVVPTFILSFMVWFQCNITVISMRVTVSVVYYWLSNHGNYCTWDWQKYPKGYVTNMLLQLLECDSSLYISRSSMFEQKPSSY